MSFALSLRSGLPPMPRLATIQVVAEPMTNGAMTDGELIARVGDGDSSAFELLYRRYSRPVFALALRRLGDRGRAEDAVQETFASIWRSAGSYRRERGPGAPWLYAVARNAIVDRRRTLGPPPAEAVEEASGEAGPDERAESSWTAWRVHRALAELPEQERRLIELAYWGGLSQSEIAEFLDIPLGTVKTRTRSALSRLGGRPGRRALVSRPPHFGDLVGNDLSPAERERLERVHDMLVAAGPPPELPQELAEAPRPQGRLVELARHRLRTGLVLAAALVIATFAFGYFLGARGEDSSPAAFTPDKTAVLGKSADRLAVVRIGERDENGNWPMVVTVEGLDHLSGGDYYTLFMTRKRKAGRDRAEPSTSARRASTTVRFSVAYDLERFDGLMLAEYSRAEHKNTPAAPGRADLVAARERCGRSRRTPRA